MVKNAEVVSQSSVGHLVMLVIYYLGRSRRSWEDNIQVDLQEVGGGCGAGWSWLRIGTGGGHL